MRKLSNDNRVPTSKEQQTAMKVLSNIQATLQKQKSFEIRANTQLNSVGQSGFVTCGLSNRRNTNYSNQNCLQSLGMDRQCQLNSDVDISKRRIETQKPLQWIMAKKAELSLFRMPQLQQDYMSVDTHLYNDKQMAAPEISLNIASTPCQFTFEAQQARQVMSTHKQQKSIVLMGEATTSPPSYKRTTIKMDEESQTPTQLGLSPTRMSNTQLSPSRDNISLNHLNADSTSTQVANQMPSQQITIGDAHVLRYDVCTTVQPIQFPRQLKPETSQILQTQLHFKYNDYKQEYAIVTTTMPLVDCGVAFKQLKQDNYNHKTVPIKMSQVGISPQQECHQPIAIVSSYYCNIMAPLKKDDGYCGLSTSQVMKSMGMSNKNNIMLSLVSSRVLQPCQDSKAVLTTPTISTLQPDTISNINQLQIPTITNNDTALKPNNEPTMPNQYNQPTLKCMTQEQENSTTQLNCSVNVLATQEAVQLQANTLDKNDIKHVKESKIENNRKKIEEIQKMIQRKNSRIDTLPNSPALEIAANYSKLLDIHRIKPKIPHSNIGRSGSPKPKQAAQKPITKQNTRCCSLERNPTKMTSANNQNSKLNRFKRLKYLGKGKFSDVYSIIDIKTGMMSALKIFQKSIISSKGLNKLILEEIKIQSYLNHPNILKCYGMIDDFKQFALVLEICECSLLQHITSHIMTQKEFIKIAAQILSAVSYLHSYGIIHRDIKPENILINQGQAKVADLGIAIRCRTSKQYCGTLGYMAPEVVKQKEYDNKADCYSVGVLIYEVMYGELPKSTDLCKQRLSMGGLNTVMAQLLLEDPILRISAKQALQNDIFKEYFNQKDTKFCDL